MKNLSTIFLFVVALIAFTIPSKAQVGYPLTYNYQVSQVAAAAKYTTVTATTYFGTKAATQIEPYFLFYSDSAGVTRETPTYVSSPATLTLRCGGTSPNFTTVIPTSTVFTLTKFKLDSTYTFTYQGVTDSLVFHQQVRFNILARSIVLNQADVINDQNPVAGAYNYYSHLFRVPNGPQVPVY